MDMAAYAKYPLFFLLAYSATIVANSVQPELSHSTSKSSLSHYPQTHENFSNDQLYHAYLVIQRFKKTITCDPQNITSTWTGRDICGNKRYLGFYCATPSGPSNSLAVTSINFHGFGLCAPKLQGFIDQLPDLAIFEATSNNFTGDIPRLAGLSYLYNLDAGDDHADQRYQPLNRHCYDVWIKAIVSGRSSGCLNYLVAEKVKEISGPAWTNAKALLLNKNQLSGPLPADLGFSKVSYLALANNNLTGPIPPSIAHLQDSLLEVLLLNNQLSGCLPRELGMLTRTSIIDAGMNQLTGPIPSSFSCLSRVEQLNLAGNRLYGQVPDTLCNLAGPDGRLANLTLSNNYFTSVGPACSALIKDGVLDVKRNCIPGFTNQRGLAECAAFMSQPKTCPTAGARVVCPAADAKKNVPASEGRVARDYSSYVTYATLHE